MHTAFQVLLSLKSVRSNIFHSDWDTAVGFCVTYYYLIVLLISIIKILKWYTIIFHYQTFKVLDPKIYFFIKRNPP